MKAEIQCQKVTGYGDKQTLTDEMSKVELSILDEDVVLEVGYTQVVMSQALFNALHLFAEEVNRIRIMNDEESKTPPGDSDTIEEPVQVN